MHSKIPTWGPSSLPNKKFDSLSLQKKFKIAVIIGRFQPFHKGHLALFRKAEEVAEETLVLLGSSESCRSVKNPLTWTEREQVIRSALEKENLYHEVYCEPIRDYWYNNAKWVEDVRSVISDYSKEHVALVGFHKDETSDYLKWFKPNFELINVNPVCYDDGLPVSAIELRNAELEGLSSQREYPHYFSDMQEVIKPSILNNLREEYAYIKAYKESWSMAPFPPTFMCSDALVIQSGHVLMIRRGDHPGKGLFALPGGYIGQNETGLTASIRELREETGLKVPEKVLIGSLFAERTFDAPERSLRGRTFTMAYGFKLDDSEALPKVKGRDDAEKALWIPFETLRKMRSQVFEDHFDMIDWFLGQL